MMGGAGPVLWAPQLAIFALPSLYSFQFPPSHEPLHDTFLWAPSGHFGVLLDRVGLLGEWNADGWLCISMS